jgi:hypothetical protein
MCSAAWACAGLPHTIYPVIAPDLEAACAACGVTYRVHPGFVAAICSHARWLRQMGQPPDDHAAERDATRNPNLN